ncbi:MAG: hypothetical protein GY761_19480 [Hyphomicrobiales bacterium]|nr:hypothetical protein [Hyphomicrobiales bacterium]
MAMIYHYWSKPRPGNQKTSNIDKLNRYRMSAFSLIALTLLLMFLQFTLNSSADAASLDTKAPIYSTLYDQLLRLEQQEKFVEALRMVPKIYAAEDIPVEAFYNTLDRKRRQLLDSIFEKELSFPIGKRVSSCSSLWRLFTNLYIGRLESFRFIVDGSRKLEFNRFCYLLIVEGLKLRPSFASSITKPSSSWIKLQAALDSADPWLVSAALFIARKQKKPTISLQAMINRWEKHPDLWDDQCTQQAILYYARLHAQAHGTLQISNEDIKRKIKELVQIPTDESYLSPVLYSEQVANVSDENLPGYSLVMLRENKGKKGVIKRWTGDANQVSKHEKVTTKPLGDNDFKNGAISVKPGWYQIRFNSVKGTPPSGYYGESAFVEVKKGELLVVPIMVFPAI